MLSIMQLLMLRVSLKSLNHALMRSNSTHLKIKMSKQLQKMISRGPKKKTIYPTSFNKGYGEALGKSNERAKGPSEGQRRRTAQVGSVLYKYITDIINSGELDPYLADMAVNISKVKVVSDFSSVNVYWVADGTDSDEKIEETLQKDAGKLRQILTSYHLLGHIPQINFVKDASTINASKVEQLLRIADFGPDFTPTTRLSQVRNEHFKGGVHNKFQSISLTHIDSVAYPDVMVVDENGCLVRNTQSLNHTDKDDKFATDCQEKDGNLGVNDLQVQNDDDTLKNNVDDAQRALLRNDIYGLQHESIMQKLLLKKQKVKYRTTMEGSELTGLSSQDTSAELTGLRSRVTFAKNSLPKIVKQTKIKKSRAKLPYGVDNYLNEQDPDYRRTIDPLEQTLDPDEFSDENS